MTDERTPLAPDLPTMAEAGVPGLDVVSFAGLVAPIGTPEPIIKKLNAALNAGLKTPQMEDAFRKIGAVPKPGTPEDFAAFIKAQYEKWQAVANQAKIKVD